MLKPQDLKTKIFLDSGDPQETEKALSLLGFLDGQTTNPSLIAKNPQLRAKIDSGAKLAKQEVNDFYRGVIEKISSLLPYGSVSVEVYADLQTSKEKMLEEAREMFQWIPNAHIKLPIINAGLAAAEEFVQEGGRVNTTLCFSQEQGMAVHCATIGAKKGDVFISPFIGRLDDIGLNGMDLIKNILQMYQVADSSVEVLAASVRTYEHFKYCLQLGVDIITAPLKILEEWAKDDLKISDESYVYNKADRAEILYRELSMVEDWRESDIFHKLTEQGIDKFVNDWNKLIGK